MKPYRPTRVVTPDGGIEQSFVANVVHVDDALIAFGDLVPDDPRGLPHGTPVHSFLVHFDDGNPELLELNDQGNTVDTGALARAVLERDHVRFEFRRGAGPFAGRVGLSKEIELFEDSLPEADGPFSEFNRFDEVQLSSVLIHFDADDAKRTCLAKTTGQDAVAARSSHRGLLKDRVGFRRLFRGTLERERAP